MAIAGEFGLDLTPEGTAALSMLDELEDIVVEVGYQADQMAIDGETSLAEIAYWNHYGTLHKDGSVMIPARPFMDALQKHPDELAEFSQQAASNLNRNRRIRRPIFVSDSVLNHRTGLGADCACHSFSGIEVRRRLL